MLLTYKKVEIQRKLVLLRVSGGFELARVRVIGVQLYLKSFVKIKDRIGLHSFLNYHYISS